MLHATILGTFFLYIISNVQIKLRLILRYHYYFVKGQISPEGERCFLLIVSSWIEHILQLKILTSVAGSNIFFNSKHSLGVPIGSGAREATCVGRTVLGRTAVGLRGMVIACCEGAAPFIAGTPRVPTTLQKEQSNQH